jgi:uncharacterized protein involved in outer membrane biogenesis
MKKWIVRILIGVVVLLVLVVLCVGFFLDGAIKAGVETFGPKFTQVDVKLQSVGLSLFSGSGKIKGLFIGNPTGYKSPSAIQVGSASLVLQPSSLLGDKVIIHSIDVQAPEVTFETDLRSNNLKKILNNVEAATGGGTSTPAPAQPKETPKSSSAGRKLEVDEFIISGGKLHVSVTTLGSQSTTVALPEIHLNNLGTGPDGITAAELTKVVLSAIEKSAAQVASQAISDLSKGAVDLTKITGTNANPAVQSVTKDLNSLLKKK